MSDLKLKKEPTWLVRNFPEFNFYSNAVLVVVAASRMARKGIYTAGRKIQSSIRIMKSLEYLGVDVKVENQAKVPVVPVAVKSDVWGMGKWLKDFGRIDPSKPLKVSLGEPVHISGNGEPGHRSALNSSEPSWQSGRRRLK